jgi:hypothetical protein
MTTSKMNKKINFSIVVAFLTIFLVASVSAFSVDSPVTFTNPETSKTITLTNTDADSNLSFNSPIDFIINGEGFSVSFRAEGETSINGTGTFTWTISNQTPLDYSKFDLGKEEYSEAFNITATKTNATNALDNEPVSSLVTVKIENTFCDYGNLGDNKIEIKGEIKDEKLGNSKEWEWEPLDEISIRVEVRNNLDTKEKITTVLSLYSVSDESFLDIDGNDDEMEETIRIGDGEREYFYFRFTLPLEDLEEGRYTLFVKAFIDGEQDSHCSSQFEKDIDVTFEEEFIVDELEDLASASCGESYLIPFKVFNLNAGDEEEFRVKIINQDLGINWNSQKYELDEGDYQTIYFDLDIPEDAKEKIYTFEVIVDYDYRESTDFFRESLSGNLFSVKVDSNCVASIPKVLITPSLESGGEVGEELIVKVTITNIGEDTQSYNLNVLGFNGWASSATATPNTLTSVLSGTSREVLINFVPLEDALGAQTFNLEISSAGDLILTQSIEVEILEKKSSFNLKDTFGDSWYLWLIGILNVLLVVVIILVAIRISRKE